MKCGHHKILKGRRLILIVKNAENDPFSRPLSNFELFSESIQFDRQKSFKPYEPKTHFLMNLKRKL